MRIKRIVSTLMTVVLLFSCLCFTGTAQAAEETTPKVVVSAVNVTKNGEPDGDLTGYLELSLLVQAKAFQTVGVVLSYDTTVLTPVDWSTSANAPELTENWTTVIPTKGADAAAGKPALAKLAEPETEGGPVTRAYLYLGASSLQYQDLSEAATRLVTARFKIASDGGAGYLPVTVPGAGAAGAALTNESFTICLAPEAVANDAIPGAQTMLTLGEETSGSDPSDLNVLDGYALKYYTWRSTIADYAEKGETACEVSFEIANGPSVNTGSTVVGGGDYAITFFDWDGRVIDAISAPETVSTDMQTLIGNIEAKLQGSKRGYAFNGWLVVYQTNDGNGLKPRYKSMTSVKAAESTPVNYDTTPSAVNNAKLYTQDMFSNYSSLKDITTKTFEDLANAADGSETAVLLQATYKATEAVNGGSAANNGAGKGENEDLGQGWTFYQFGTPSYYQYGAADVSNGQYGIRIPLTREDVLRADLPAIQAQVYVNVNGKTEIVIVKVDLENTDDTSFEVVVPKSATQVSLRLRDTYNASDWTNSQGRSEERFVMNAEFVKGGALAALIEESWQVAKAGGKWTNTVNAQCFKDAGCAVNNVDNAKAALVAKVNVLNRRLTNEEVATAVSGK